MKTIYSPQFARNYGFWNEAEQAAIIAAKVAIAGVGGDGFQLGLKLAQMGVGTFDVADPEVFEVENINRVPGATTSTIGRSKAVVFKERVLDINPEADVKIYTEGVTPENVRKFLSRASLVFDESELTKPEIGVALAREARRRKVPYVLVMNIGFAAQVTSFRPESRRTFERFMGIPEDLPLKEVAKLSVDFTRCLPYIPAYADLRTLAAVRQGASLPSVAQGVDIASALGATQAFLHITSQVNNHRRQPIWAPKIMWVDAYSGKVGATRLPRVSHYRHLLVALIRTLLRINPQASYTDEARQNRQA